VLGLVPYGYRGAQRRIGLVPELLAFRALTRPAVAEPALCCASCTGDNAGMVRYCSVTCQRAHWPKHKSTCILGGMQPDRTTAGAERERAGVPRHPDAQQSLMADRMREFGAAAS
jgi:hypothetical protein